MSDTKTTPRRARVPGDQNANIYRSTNAAGQEVFEIGYRDSTGKQRWTRVAGGITAARHERDGILGRKARREPVSANPRLRFGDAADKWLAGPVQSLRPATGSIYSSHVKNHLRERFGRYRLDQINGDDIAKMIRELRADGKSEWTISGIVKTCSQIYKYATIRLGWHGVNPTTLLQNGERPKTGSTTRRRIYQADELGQTLRAAREPYKTLFALAAVTGARLSELLGLTWQEIDIEDLDAASVRFEEQVDRKGKRSPLKTEESRRTVEIPRQLATMLAKHKLTSKRTGHDAFVFATSSGRALAQRNVIRALRSAQTRAVNDDGKPTFPRLHDIPKGEHPPKDAAPSFHGFRHSAASEAIAAGESAEEVSWQLGHKSSLVTRAVYVQEIKSAERTAKRRATMAARYGNTLEAADLNEAQQTAVSKTDNLVDLQAVRDAGK